MKLELLKDFSMHPYLKAKEPTKSWKLNINAQTTGMCVRYNTFNCELGTSQGVSIRRFRCLSFQKKLTKATIFVLIAVGLFLSRRLSTFPVARTRKDILRLGSGRQERNDLHQLESEGQLTSEGWRSHEERPLQKSGELEFNKRARHQSLSNHLALNPEAKRSDASYVNVSINGYTNENYTFGPSLLNDDGDIPEDMDIDLTSRQRDASFAFDGHHKLLEHKSLKDKEKIEEEEDTGLWVDRYRPRKSSDLVGNRDTVERVKEWLNWWLKKNQEEIELEAKNITTASSILPNKRGADYRQPQGTRFKAILLSGRPGIGKTCLSHLIPKELGIYCYELNASDERSREKLKRVLFEATQTRSIDSTGRLGKRCVLMDEVDGMHGSGDSGGMQYLISTIRNSRIPFICTCNDRSSSKVQSLSRICYDLPMRKPHKSQIAQRLIYIGKKEGLDITQEAAEEFAIRSGCDVRSSINFLQSLNGLQGIEINKTFIEMHLAEIEEDSLVQLSSTEALNKIFLGNQSGLSFDLRLSLADMNWEELTELAAENYARAIDEDERRNETEKLKSFIECQAIEETMMEYKNWVYGPSKKFDKFQGQFDLINDRPVNSVRDYR